MSSFFSILGNLGNMQQYSKKNYTKLCTDIIYEILNDENKVKSFVKKLNNIQKYKKDIFIKNFNDIILNKIISNEVDINIDSDFYTLYSLSSSTKTINDKINFLLSENKKIQTPGFINILYNIGDYTSFEFNMQLFLCELDKLTDAKKESILKIFYDIMGDELPNKSNSTSEKTNDEELKEDIKENDLQNIDKEKINNYIKNCKDKLKEIKELSQDFEYAIKNDYHKDCYYIESRLNNCVDNKDELNKIIDDINNLYRNAYNRKYNKSSLSYIMDIEEDDIDLLEHI